MDKVTLLARGEDRAMVTLNFGSLTGLIDISWSTINGEAHSSQLEQVTIEGDNGTIKLMSDKGDMLKVTSCEERWQRPAFEATPEQAYQASYTAAQRHFIECLREGRTPETVASDNFKTLKVTLAAYRSAQENQVIRLERS
jgi:predicted dehydrogenase